MRTISLLISVLTVAINSQATQGDDIPISTIQAVVMGVFACVIALGMFAIFI